MSSGGVLWHSVTLDAEQKRFRERKEDGGRISADMEGERGYREEEEL